MISDLVRKASEEYYKGSPIMSDEMYDHLFTLANIEDVGYSDISEKRFPHLYPMFSLQKVWEGEDTPDFPCAVVTPKFDGAAISILIADGKVQKVLTRGDGKEGLDITRLMSKKLPTSFSHTAPMQITGEVVAPKTIPNARNYAAGALNLKSVDEFMTRDVRFIAYGINVYPTENYESDLDFIESLGFDTVTSIADQAEDYPQDGLVIRVNSNQKFDNLGFTSHHPRGAYALKKREPGVVTTLLGVEWQVGKSGAVSPVAILDPVMIEDALVSRASLHNKAIIEALNLEIGCYVEVIRAGKIIPQIVQRIG
jgi:NAD-dependent DNA ligase